MANNKASGDDGIPVELFRILKDDAVKVLHSICSKFGKISSGQRIGKDQSTSLSQRRALPKNAPTTVQLHSFHTLAMLCSKSYKVGFSSMWTENSQKCKLDFEGAEQLETKLLTCAGLWRKPGSSRKTSTVVPRLTSASFSDEFA